MKMLYLDPYYTYDINYLSKKYAKKNEIRYRLPSELEGMLYLKDRWKKIYKANQNIIKRMTYYSMKGHIRHRQYDMFFKYMNHLRLKNTYLFGIEAEFEKYMNTKSIPEKRTLATLDGGYTL